MAVDDVNWLLIYNESILVFYLEFYRKKVHYYRKTAGQFVLADYNRVADLICFPSRFDSYKYLLLSTWRA